MTDKIFNIALKILILIIVFLLLDLYVDYRLMVFANDFLSELIRKGWLGEDMILNS